MNNQLISTIADFTARVLGVTTIEELLIHVQDFIDSNFNTIQTAIYLYSQSENKLRMYHTKGFNDEEVSVAEETALERHPGWVFKTGEILYIPDTLKSDFPHLRIVTKRTRTGSRLFIPVRNDREIIGVFGIVSPEIDAFDKSDIDLLTFLANVAGTAFSKLRESAKKKEFEDKLLLHDRALFYINNGVVITDAQRPDYPMVYVNKAFERITGYSESEVLGKNCRFLQGSERNQPGIEKLRNALKNGEECSLVLKNFRKDGALFWNELTVTPIFSESGNLTNYIGIQNDITAKVLYEQHLRDITTRVGTIISSLHSGILVEDEYRHVVLTNEEFMKMFGIPGIPQELIGMDCAAAADELKVLFMDPPGFINRIDEILSNRKSVISEELWLADGRILARDYIPVFIQENYRGHLWQYRDITDSVRTQALIEASEKKYRQIIENASDLIFTLDESFKFIFINPSAKHTFAYSDEFYNSVSFKELLEPEAQLLFDEKINELINRDAEKINFEIQIKTNSHSKIWLGINARVNSGEGGQLYFEMFARDVTESNMYEREISRLKTFYETILNDLPGQIAVFDSQLNYMFLNPQSIQNKELRAWLIGKNDFDYVKRRGLEKSVAERRTENLRRVLEERKAVSFEEEIIRPDGEIKYFFRAVSPIFSPEGEVKYLIGYGIDITELRKAEKALAKSERQLSTVLNTVGEGIAVFDNEGRITLVNNEIGEIWKCNTDELINKHVSVLFAETEFISPDKGVSLRSKLLPVLGKFIEKTAVRSDGSVFPAELKINESKLGEKQIFTCSIKDVTERKKTFDELVLAKQAAEASTRVKEQFLAHTSHEIRTPMNAVLGLTSLLLGMNPTNEQRQFLENIKSSAENLLVIINDVLDLSKIEAGRFEFSEERFSFREMIDHVLQIAGFSATEKNLYLTKEIDSEIPDILIGDPVRLGQILTNLVSNGIKFTKKGGVTVFASHEKITETECNIIMRIKDTGIGITPEDLGTIFEPYRQSKQGSALAAKGSGLGLAIVKLMLEKMGGSVSVRSMPGIGSEFTISFPVKISEIQDATALPIKNEPLYTENSMISGLRVLIAEDNQVNQLVVSNTLKLWGVVYDIAGNGKECIELLKKNDYDCILMDLAMPVMDGYEASAFIRRSMPEPKKSVPIIALTASVLIASENRIQKAGMNSHLSKPFKPVDLYNKILELTGPAKHTPDLKSAADSDGKKEMIYKGEYIDLTETLEMVGGSVEVLNDLIREFLAAVPGTVDEIINDLSKRDFRNAARLTHKIKPAFYYMGMTGAHDKLQELEAAAKSEESQELCLQLASEIQKEIEKSRPELERFLG